MDKSTNSNFKKTTAINELIGRENNKRAMKKLVKLEQKSDKTELKILV